MYTEAILFRVWGDIFECGSTFSKDYLESAVRVVDICKGLANANADTKYSCRLIIQGDTVGLVGVLLSIYPERSLYYVDV